MMIELQHHNHHRPHQLNSDIKSHIYNTHNVKGVFMPAIEIVIDPKALLGWQCH